jgi:hypothetical protein
LCISISSSVVVGCAPGATEPEEETAGGRWEIVLQKEIEQPMRVAAFLDESFGLTGGPADPGMAHYSTDGGETWTMADGSAA